MIFTCSAGSIRVGIGRRRSRSWRSLTNLASSKPLRMQIVRFLGCDGAFPLRLAAVRAIVVPCEQSSVGGKLQNALDTFPKLPSITTGEIRACGTRIWHENGIVHEGCVPYDVSHGAQRVTRA